VQKQEGQTGHLHLYYQDQPEKLTISFMLSVSASGADTVCFPVSEKVLSLLSRHAL